MTRQRHFGRYMAVPDGPGTAAVLDRTTDEAVKGTEKLPASDATELARDWNRYLEEEASA